MHTLCYFAVLTLLCVSNVASLQFFGTLEMTTQLAGNITDLFPLNNTGEFFGLSYVSGDENYGPTQFYTIRRPDDGGVSYFDTITSTTSLLIDRFNVSSNSGATNLISLAFASGDLGHGSSIFYYLRKVFNATTFGTLTPGAVGTGGQLGVGVAQDYVTLPSGFDSLAFASVDFGLGANKFYYLRHDEGNCTSYFGMLDPTAVVPVVDMMPLGVNFDALKFVGSEDGFGTNKFYYLRHDSNNVSFFGIIDPVALSSNDLFELGPNYNQITYTSTDTGFGPNLFYYLRGAEFISCVIETPIPTLTPAAPTPSVPTIPASTTPAPTTPAPTTSAPTSSAPTTSAPTSSAPTTSAPTTPVPTTSAPTSAAPTSAAPTTPAPTTSAPTSAAPTTSAPTTSAPTASAPTTPAPTTSAPTTSAPTNSTTPAPTNNTTPAPTNNTTSAPSTPFPAVSSANILLHGD